MHRTCEPLLRGPRLLAGAQSLYGVAHLVDGQRHGRVRPSLVGDHQQGVRLRTLTPYAALRVPHGPGQAHPAPLNGLIAARGPFSPPSALPPSPTTAFTPWAGHTSPTDRSRAPLLTLW